MGEPPGDAVLDTEGLRVSLDRTLWSGVRPADCWTGGSWMVSETGIAPTHATRRTVMARKNGMGVLGCISNLGRCTSQGVGEAVFSGFTTCPNGNPGIALTLVPGTGHGFTRFEKKGDMLFSELLTEDVSYDSSTRMHFKSGTGRYTGGRVASRGRPASTSSREPSGCCTSMPTRLDRPLAA